MRLWNATAGAHIATLKGHSDLVGEMAFSPDGSRLVSGSSDHTLRLWDVRSGAHLATLEGHEHSVKYVGFSPDGSRLVSAFGDSTLRLWDGVSGVHIATLRGHFYPADCVAFSPDGSRLASGGSKDPTLRLWDAMSGAHIVTREFHSRSVTSVAFSPDGLWLASGSKYHPLQIGDDMSGSHGPTVQLWDGMSGAHITALDGHSDQITSLAFSSDSHTLISRTRFGSLHMGFDIRESSSLGLRVTCSGLPTYSRLEFPYVVCGWPLDTGTTLTGRSRDTYLLHPYPL